MPNVPGSNTDPLSLLVATPGLTATSLATYLYAPDRSRQPKRNEVEKARRQLDGLVKKGLASRQEPVAGGTGGTQPTTYWPTRASAHEQPESTHGSTHGGLARGSGR